MGYQILMLKASNEYKGSSWLAYNRRFRQQTVAHPNCEWSKIDSTIWNLAFTGQAKANCCRHCFSLFHLSKDCAFASSTTSSHSLCHIVDDISVNSGTSNLTKSVPSRTVAMKTSAITVRITLQLLMSIIRLYIAKAILASNLPLANILNGYSHDHDLLRNRGRS